MTLVRQRAGDHPSAASALGERASCWMVDDIAPDYGTWQVQRDSFRSGGACMWLLAFASCRLTADTLLTGAVRSAS